jgi:exopolysaccharide biosynthesis polyprenyl glycosylphosphotransferase
MSTDLSIDLDITASDLEIAGQVDVETRRISLAAITALEASRGDGTTVRAVRLPRPDVADDDPRALMDRYRRRAMLLDATAAVLAGLVAITFRFQHGWPTSYTVLTTSLPALWICLLGLQRTYEHRYIGVGPDEYRRVTDAGIALVASLAVASYASHGELSRLWLLVAVPITVLLTLFFRRLLRGWLHGLRLKGEGQQKVLVVGRADAVVSVIEKLDHEPGNGLVPVGACIPPVGVHSSHVNGVPVVGDPDQILDVVDELGVDVVAVVSHPDLSGQALRRLAWALEERCVELVVSPGIIEVAGPRLSIRPVAGLSLLHLERPAITGGRRIMKTVFDRFVGSVLLLLGGPALAVIAVLIKATSPGPVLFRQTRIGVNGNEFTMLKFRSMVVDAEQRKTELAEQNEGNGVLFKMRRDPRVTRVGAVIRRFSLDELPQLINIVRGDMSLVGPRPPLPEEVAIYSADATRRLRVRPGLTGLWQVSGRSDLTWEESLRLDLRYVDNWSLALDLAILWKTGRAVVLGGGAQ